MSTPAKPDAHGTAIEKPESHGSAIEKHVAAPEPVVEIHQQRDFGWLILLVGGLTALVSSWTLFPANGTEGMWAGYWCTLLGTVILLAVMGLRTTIPAMFNIASAGVSGAALLLVGLFRGYDQQVITIPMIAAGVITLVGAALAAAGARSRA